MPRTTSTTRKVSARRAARPAKRAVVKIKKQPAAKKQQPKTKRPAQRSAKRANKKTTSAMVQPSTLATAIPPVTVLAPVVQSAPSLTMAEPADQVSTTAPVIATNYKHLPSGHSRSKVWLAVTATSAIIMVVWLYFLQQSWLTVPQSVTESIENSNIEALVTNIEDQFSTMKSSAQALDSQTQPVTTAVPVTNATTNSSEDLNNLFSDLQ